ncbi:MAG: putative immunity protein [Oscillospiraceae bacterium]
MGKLRKMLGHKNSPYIVPLMRLLETQSKETIARWCLGYAEAHILPIYEKEYPADVRPRSALAAARRWFAGSAKLPEVKRVILEECHAAARQAQSTPAAQAAARACGHMPAHSLGLAFYGAAALAYSKAGFAQSPVVYEEIAAEECAKMEAALRAIMVENEPCPAKLNWHCTAF